MISFDNMFSTLSYKLFAFALITCSFLFACKKKDTTNPSNPPILTESYSGMLKTYEWGPPGPGNNTADSGISTVTVTHLTSQIANNKDTVKVVFSPIFYGKPINDSITFPFNNGNADSLEYFTYYGNPGTATLTKYYNPDRINMYISYYTGVVSGITISFSGKKK